MKIALIHGLSSKPAFETLKASCEKSIGRPITLVYWADLMGYKSYPDFDASKPYSTWEKLISPIRGVIRRSFKEVVETSLNPFYGWVSKRTNELSLKIYGNFLPDLDRYFNHGYREAVKDRLRKAFPCDILIAHSMGAIIAADLLADGTHRVTKLITIGAPLGLGFIKEQLDLTYARHETLRRAIRTWINIYDPLDAVSLDHDLSDEFTGVKDIRVRNLQIDETGARHYHSLYGYLKTPELQAAI